MQLSCIYVVVNCTRPVIQWDSHFTSIIFIVKIFDANGFRLSVRLKMGDIKCSVRTARLRRGCTSEEIMEQRDEIDENSFVQVIKLCPRHLHQNITEEGLVTH